MLQINPCFATPTPTLGVATRSCERDLQHPLPRWGCGHCVGRGSQCQVPVRGPSAMSQCHVPVWHWAGEGSELFLEGGPSAMSHCGTGLERAPSPFWRAGVTRVAGPVLAVQGHCGRGGGRTEEANALFFPSQRPFCPPRPAGARRSRRQLRGERFEKREIPIRILVVCLARQHLGDTCSSSLRLEGNTCCS